MIDPRQAGHDSPDLTPAASPSERIQELRDRLRRLVVDYRESLHDLKTEIEAARDGSTLGELLDSAARDVGIDADTALLLVALATSRVTVDSPHPPLDASTLLCTRWHPCGFQVGSRLILAVPMEAHEDHEIGWTTTTHAMQLSIIDATAIERPGETVQ